MPRLKKTSPLERTVAPSVYHVYETGGLTWAPWP
jgi:hypothetical protein